MQASVKGARRYRATLRDEQAQLTRGRILAAARRLFLGGAYDSTTMHDIAREADVAYQTVYAQFGNKLQLALELCASELPHVGHTVAMLTAAREGQDPEAWLRLMGSFARRLYEPCAEVLRFMRESGDADLLRRYSEIQLARRQLLVDLGPQLEKAGHLREGLSGPRAVDIVWTMAGPEIYAHFVLDAKWTPQEFENWLGPALVDLILAR
jgi:AcrR family transcriptional regulator